MQTKQRSNKSKTQANTYYKHNQRAYRTTNLIIQKNEEHTNTPDKGERTYRQATKTE